MSLQTQNLSLFFAKYVKTPFCVKQLSVTYLCYQKGVLIVNHAIWSIGKIKKYYRRILMKFPRLQDFEPRCSKVIKTYKMLMYFIGRLRKSGEQKVDSISLLLNKFS